MKPSSGACGSTGRPSSCGAAQRRVRAVSSRGAAAAQGAAPRPARLAQEPPRPARSLRHSSYTRATSPAAAPPCRRLCRHPGWLHRKGGSRRCGGECPAWATTLLCQCHSPRLRPKGRAPRWRSGCMGISGCGGVAGKAAAPVQRAALCPPPQPSLAPRRSSLPFLAAHAAARSIFKVTSAGRTCELPRLAAQHAIQAPAVLRGLHLPRIPAAGARASVLQVGWGCGRLAWRRQARTGPGPRQANPSLANPSQSHPSQGPHWLDTATMRWEAMAPAFRTFIIQPPLCVSRRLRQGGRAGAGGGGGGGCSGRLGPGHGQQAVCLTQVAEQ